MIALAADCLLFQLASGESVPISAEMLSVDLMGETAQSLDPEFVGHAAKAIFHYFKHELRRQTLTVGEFSEAFEKVLNGFKFEQPVPAEARSSSGVQETDLCGLARQNDPGGELFFFPLLRNELRQHLRQHPRLLRFHGLRGCVKLLAGVQRWNGRCRRLEERIVDYLRECLSAEARPSDFALVVE